MHIVRGIVVAGVLVAGSGGLVPGAAADCSGPMLSLGSTVVDRGERFVVTGQALGDNCYDTGPPPEGEGTLGRPLDDLEVVIVQDGVEVVLAEGHADDRYSFSTNAVVPGTFTPGPATIDLRRGTRVVWSSATDSAKIPFRISEEPPGDVPWGVASFTWQGPVPTTAAVTPPLSSDSRSALVPGLVGGAIGAVVATIAVLAVPGLRRRGAGTMA